MPWEIDYALLSFSQLKKVQIKVENSVGIDYIGTYRGLPNAIVGLEQGIKNMYNTIKQNK